MSPQTLEDKTVKIRIEGSIVGVNRVEGNIKKVHGIGFHIESGFERYLRVFFEGFEGDSSRDFIFRGDPPLEAGDYIRAGIVLGWGAEPKAIYVEKLGSIGQRKRIDFMSGYNPSTADMDRLGIL